QLLSNPVQLFSYSRGFGSAQRKPSSCYAMDGSPECQSVTTEKSHYANDPYANERNANPFKVHWFNLGARSSGKKRSVFSAPKMCECNANVTTVLESVVCIKHVFAPQNLQSTD
ncbi:uncharacterized protein V6R79_011154, partial [Siganus canaliculatus]